MKCCLHLFVGGEGDEKTLERGCDSCDSPKKGLKEGQPVHCFVSFALNDLGSPQKGQPKGILSSLVKRTMRMCLFVGYTRFEYFRLETKPIEGSSFRQDCVGMLVLEWFSGKPKGNIPCPLTLQLSRCTELPEPQPKAEVSSER